jgi:uncharacterized membrane protein YhdT
MLSSLLYIWYISLPLFVITVIAFFKWVSKEPLVKIPLKYALSCFIFPILFISTILVSETETIERILKPILTYVFYGILVLQILLSGFFTWKTPKEARFILVMILIWEFLLSIYVGFISAMTVSGVYL